MKTIKQVLDRANKTYDKHMNEEPTLFEERGRNAYLVGCLESAYEVLYDKLTSKKK